MEIFWLFILWLHVIAAVVWIGGNLILAMVIVPYFKQKLPPVQRIQLLTQIGKRFQPVVWGCVLVLLFTGIANIFDAVDFNFYFNAEYQGTDIADVGTPGDPPNPVDSTVFSASQFINTFMRTLFIKLILFIVLIVLTFLHSVFFGPRLSTAIEGLDPELAELPPEVKRLRTQMAVVSSLIGVVSLLILLAAVALRQGI